MHARWITSVGYLVSVGVLLLLAPGRWATAAEEKSSCSDADALVATNPEAARDAYITLLDNPDARACAVEGLGNAAIALQNDDCAIAEALIQAKRPGEAEKEYLKDIEHPAERACAISGLQGIHQSIANLLTALTGDILEAILKILGIFLAILVVYVIARSTSRRQLVVADFADATALPGVKDQVPGTSQLFREELARRLQAFRASYLAKQQSPPGVTPEQWQVISRTPSPRAALDTTASDLAAAVKDVPGGVGPLTQALTATLFRPRGVKVAGHLQRRGDVPDRLGVSFEIADLRLERPSSMLTTWEPTIPGSPPAFDSSAVPDRARILRAVSERSKAGSRFADSARYLEEAERLRPIDGGQQDLLLARQRAADQAARRELFRQGALRESGSQRNEAIQRYVLTLPPAKQPEARQLWPSALNGGPGAGQALRALAPLYADALLDDEALGLLARAAGNGDAEAATERTQRARNLSSALIEGARLLLELGDVEGAATFASGAKSYTPDDLRVSSALGAVQDARTAADAKAAGRVAIGRMYRGVGAIAEAKAEFVAALSEKPFHLGAATDLQAVLALPRTPSERFGALIPPAALRVCLELLRREELADA